MGRIFIDVMSGAGWLQRVGDVASWRPGNPLPPDTGITVIAPAEGIALHRIELPVRRGAELRQAVPFALEDRLAEPVESLHFAIGARDGALVDVAVVARRVLGEWLDQLASKNIAADQLLADAHLLPRTDDALHVAHVGDRVLVASIDSAYATTALDWPRWRALLPELPIRSLGRDGAFHADAATVDRLDLPTFLRHMAARVSTAPDLLQDAFAPRKRTAGQKRVWRWAAVLAGAAVVLALGDAAIGVVTEQARRDRLRAEQGELFRQALPDARMTGDPAAQMAAELDRSRRGSRAGGPFALLTQAAPLIVQGSRYRLEGIDYRLGVLELDVATGDVASLDALRESLASGGIGVEVTGVTPGNGGVRGRLRLRGATS